eukprot:m.890013 g.890013  ORF g.890013 m.890013 type:complete len:349 (+) comp23648_c0_seq5:267-1313(+)
MANAGDLIVTRPDDWHLHLRDGEGLKSLGKMFPNIVSRAIIMPNLKPPVTTTEQAQAYRERIMKSLPDDTDFVPLMTLYLTDNTSPDEIQKAHDSGLVKAVKLYPAGATTNSDHGVTDMKKVQPALAKMAEVGMPLCVHGEVTDKSIDIFEREPVFLTEKLTPLLEANPTLKVILEHITTKEAVDFVKTHGKNVAATITAHHLLYNRNAIFDGGVRPHMYCLPVLKHETDRQALLGAIKSGSPKFFMGTDSAPHDRSKKETACGCAGVYTAHAALELYAMAFEEANCLEHLDQFVGVHGAKFYSQEINTRKVKLTKSSWTVPQMYPFGDGELVPLKAGAEITWKAVLL